MIDLIADKKLALASFLNFKGWVKRFVALKPEVASDAHLNLEWQRILSMFQI